MNTADAVVTIESSGSAGASAQASAIPATTDTHPGPADPLGSDCVGLVFTMTSSDDCLDATHGTERRVAPRRGFP